MSDVFKAAWQTERQKIWEAVYASAFTDALEDSLDAVKAEEYADQCLLRLAQFLMNGDLPPAT